MAKYLSNSSLVRPWFIMEPGSEGISNISSRQVNKLGSKLEGQGSKRGSKLPPDTPLFI